MPIIGVRELRERTAEILRQLQEQNTEYVITHQGRPVAILLPVSPESVEAATVEGALRSAASRWDMHARLIEEIGRRWPPERTTQGLLDASRR